MRFALPVAVLAATPVLVACTQNATAEDTSSSRAGHGHLDRPQL